MNSLIALLAVIVLTAGCIGYGYLILALFRAHGHIGNVVERGVLCFVLGFGFFGWIAFFPGVFGFFRPEIFWGLALALVLAMDVLEGVSPPGDADTLSYHYALPRDFLAAGRIEFVPRAVSGAIPLLLHMTYAAALATGGELALTMWGMLTGWVTGLLLYVVARRYASRVWALALAIVFLTTPATLYGGGNGHAEIRCAAFALASVMFIVAADRNAAYRLLALAGICAGYFLGAKFYGLIFVGSAGLVLSCHRDGLRRGVIFGGAALVAGFQWYLWNWIHTGDPVFPTIFNLLQLPDTPYWTREFGLYFAGNLAQSELPLDRSLINWLTYPVLSVFNIVEALEGGRTGFGIFSFLILPLAIFGLSRTEYRRREYIVPLTIAFVFFTVWFFSGTTQRTRHLLSVYPLVLISLFPIAVAVARSASIVRPLAAAIFATLAIQLSGQAVFSANYARHIFSAETRPQFLARNVDQANVADWINRELPRDGRIGFLTRQLAYLIERPAYMMHPHLQLLVEARPIKGDERRFVGDLRRQGISYVLLPVDPQQPKPGATTIFPFHAMVYRLVTTGCLHALKSFKTVPMASRTLRHITGAGASATAAVYRLVPDKCPKDN